MGRPLNQLLAEGAAEIVNGSFTGVSATWWWERRMGGGIEVCQELDPAEMSRELAERLNREPEEVWQTMVRELGLEDADPVVLTFEIPGDATDEEAAKMLAKKSAAREGLASGLYRQIEDAVERG